MQLKLKLKLNNLLATCLKLAEAVAAAAFAGQAKLDFFLAVYARLGPVSNDMIYRRVCVCAIRRLANRTGCILNAHVKK